MNNSINVSVLRDSGLNDSIYGSGLRRSSPLSREIDKAQSGYRESADQFKQVNFAIVTQTQFGETTPTGMSSLNMSPSVAAAGDSQHQASASIPLKKSSVVAPATNRPPQNFRSLAKQSFEKQSSRNIKISDTMDSFFDHNKLYIKSVQHEATMR